MSDAIFEELKARILSDPMVEAAHRLGQQEASARASMQRRDLGTAISLLRMVMRHCPACTAPEHAEAHRFLMGRR